MKKEIYIKQCDKTITIDLNNTTIHCLANIIKEMEKCGLPIEERDSIIHEIVEQYFKYNR